MKDPIDLKDRITEGARRLFIQYGVRSVSMDDVAHDLSVSKKTLYQHFANKDELVTEVVHTHMKGERDEFDHIAEQATNSIEELFLLSKCMREHVFKINPSLLYDLEKYHSDAWKIFQEFKKEFITGQIIKNLEWGIKEGYYRNSIDPKVLATLRMEIVQMVFDQHVFPQDEFNFVEVQVQIFDHFVHGLLSEEGKKLYFNYQQLEHKSSLT